MKFQTKILVRLKFVLSINTVNGLADKTLETSFSIIGLTPHLESFIMEPVDIQLKIVCNFPICTFYANVQCFT